MKKINLFAVNVCILLTSSCTKFVTHLRVKPQLVYEDGLIITNSQTNPYRFNYENKILKINYSIIIKNISLAPKELDLKKTYYEVNQEKNDIKCVFTKTNDYKRTLKTDEQAAIECLLTITPNTNNQLALKDSDITLTIPLEKNIHNFTYRVFAEEFSR